MADRPQNVLIGAFVTLLCTLFFVWLLVKLVFFLICLRYKCKITFKFKRFHQLTNIHIVKHGGAVDETSRPVDGSGQDEPFVEIFIDRLWFSSCYFNRQIKNRLMICLSGIHMTYSHPSSPPRGFGDLLSSTTTASEENIYMQYLFWVFYLFFKYLGSIHIQNLSVKLFNLFRTAGGGLGVSDGKCKYVGVNIEYFKVELTESNRSNVAGCHDNEEPADGGDEENNFPVLYEINKNREVSKLNGSKMLKVSMRNMQLKAFRLKSSVPASSGNQRQFDTSQHQIIGEMTVKSSDLDVLLNKLNTTAGRKRAISFQGSLNDQLIEYVNCMHVYIDETSGHLYKFNSTKSYFNDDLSHLVEFLTNNKSSRRPPSSSNSSSSAMKRAFVSVASKIQILEITSMEATCIVTNHHSQRSFSANSSLSSSYKFAKRDKIKLDVLKFFSAAATTGKWGRQTEGPQTSSASEPRACIGFVLLRNLHYYKMNRYNYSLINQLAVSLTKTTQEPKDGGSSLYSLLWSCENANLYLHLKLLNDLISSKMFAASAEPQSPQSDGGGGVRSHVNQFLASLFDNGHNNSNSLLLRFKFKSSYLHLIETVRPGLTTTTSGGFSPKNFIYVYSIGSKLFHLKYHHHLGPGGQRNFDLVLNQSIVFKSTKSGGDTISSGAKTANSSQLGKLKFTNNLFENNQEWNLNELFDSISCCTSTPPRRSSNQVCNSNHRHYWGQLFNLNSLNLHYEGKMAGESCINLSMSSIHVEYTASFFSIINQLLVSNAQVVKKLVDSLQPPPEADGDHYRKPPPQVFINIQSIHVYLFFEKVIFLYLKLDEINYQSIQKTSQKKTSNSKNGFCLLINEINFLQLKIDECYLQNNDVALAQAKASTFINSDHRIASYNPAEYLNYFIIYDFLESSNSDYNLILLIKSLNLNSHQAENRDETWYFTIQDIMFTWSFQIHFIVHDTLLTPFSRLVDSAKHNLKLFRRSNLDRRFEFKVLLESDVLVNFLFDYSQDSSKLAPSSATGNSGTSASYFSVAPTTYSSNLNPHDVLYPSPYIQTVSIILIGVYFKSSNQGETAFKISDVTMYINVDDQNIYSVITSDNSGGGHENCEGDDERTHQTTHCQRQFFHATSIEWASSSTDQDQTLGPDRELIKTESPSNRLCKVSFDLFHVNFIFKYDFAKLIDHILNLRKCFKLLNGGGVGVSASQADQLSSDLLLTFDKLKLTIEDDPFEVKLAYNYALMVDEYHESVKRRQTLDQRRLIKEQHLEQEAFALLREHESKIYLQRSKMIYKSNLSQQQQSSSQSQAAQKQRIRTELFTILAEKVHFFALADSAWHTRQQCYDILRKIDAESPPPPPMSADSTNPADCYWILWCRYTNLLMNSIKFQFRDYTQPLMKIKEFYSFGHVVGSEYLPAPRSKRDVKIGIGTEFKSISDAYTFNIQRNMSPFKFYHDLCCKFGFFSFAYGPNMEGSMAQLNLSLDKIIHPPRDPSRPMPWWDKSRLYLHGRLTASMDQAQIIYHVSMDPYNRTEEMKLVWSGLYFDWTNMKMLFKGMLDVYLNTESKYDDCRLLHLPNLELTIDIEWLCKVQNNPQLLGGLNKSPFQGYNSANSHNYVLPCAADKLPAIINSCEHDSFAQFRSERANLSFSFVCTIDNDVTTLKPTNSDSAAKLAVPTLKFYASTSRFLQKIKNMLSAITRPTRRGRIFQNLKPRKPILSRHFKLVSFNLDIPKLNIIYWSSASEEYGLNLECDHFRLNSVQSLELVPFADNLKRRPRPCWSTDLMKCSFEEISIYLMSPVAVAQHKESSKIFNDETFELQASSCSAAAAEQPSSGGFQSRERNFFMRIESILYEREKESKSSLFQNKSSPTPNGTLHSRVSTDSILTTNEMMFSSSFNNDCCVNETKPAVRIKKNRSLMMTTGGRGRQGGDSASQSFRSPSSVWKYKRESAKCLSTSSSSEAIKGLAAANFSKAYQPSATSFLRHKFHTIARNTSLNEWLLKNGQERPRSYGLLMENDKCAEAGEVGINKLNEAINSTSSFANRINTVINEVESTAPMPTMASKVVSSNTSLVPPIKSLPKHNIKITNLKAKWNTVNRDVIFTLYEIYSKAKRLRHNLSSEALKQFDIFLDDQIVNNFNAASQQQQQFRQSQQHLNNGFSRKPSVNANKPSSQLSGSTPFANLSSIFAKEPNNNSSSTGGVGENSNTTTFFEELLNKLDSERNSKVYCDEGVHVEANSFNDLLYGVHSVTKMFDILEESVYVEFINSQVKLSLDNMDSAMATKKSTDSTDVNSTPIKQQQQNSQLFRPMVAEQRESNENEYLIISAAKAFMVKRIHQPVWKSQRLLDKTSWTGNLESMQYFATLSIDQKNGPPPPSCQDNDGSKDNDSTSSSSQLPNKKRSNLRYIDEDFLDQNNEYWLSEDIIDPSGGKSARASKVVGHQSKMAMDENADHQSMDDSDGGASSSAETSNSSSFNDLSNLAVSSPAKIMKNTLGMLIAYKNKDYSSYQVSSPPVVAKTTPIQPTGNKATRNLRRGLILLRRNNNANNKNDEPVQKCQSSSSAAHKYLQMIVSKCRCEFHIIDYDDKLPNIDGEGGEKVYLSNNENGTSKTMPNSQIFPNFGHMPNLLNSNSQIDLNASFNEPVDCFTLIHHDMNLCTNSQQYKMIMDIVNNLVLYFRPRRKEVIDKQRSIKFNLQLSMGNLDSLKQHIQLKQIETKELLCKLRALERRLYHSREKIENEVSAFDGKYGFRAYEMIQAVPNQSQSLDSSNMMISSEFAQINDLKLENIKMDNEYNACKKKLNLFSDELNILISCYKELLLEKRAFALANGSTTSNFSNHNNNQYLSAAPMTNGLYFSNLTNNQYQAKAGVDRKIDLDQQAQESIINNEIGRRYEIWFKHIQWKLNDEDGQTGCAKFLMKNFIYTKVAATPNQQELDCVEHNLEIESCKIQDLCAPSSRKAKKSSKNGKRNGKRNNEDTAECKLETYVLTSMFDTCIGNLNNLNNENDDMTASSSTLPPPAYLTNSHTMMFRIFCKERPPVGIPVIEHLELNLSPLVIKLTNRFYKMMMKFFFDQQQQTKIGNVTNATPMMTSDSSKASKSSISKTALNSANSTLANHYQRHSYRISSANDDQINNMLQVSLGTTTLNGIGGHPSAATPISMSPCSATSASIQTNSQQLAIQDAGRQQLASSIIQSPMLSKSLLQKKASQSSLFSVNVNSPGGVNNVHPNAAVLLQLAAAAEKGLNSARNSSSDQLQNEDIEIMKQRSANNNTFLCIKIPEIQLLVSYKGNKEKNIKDLTDVSLLFPLFEVHDKTWTWLDLINALKSHVKKALVSQAIKHKLIKVPIKPVNKLINRNRRSHSQQQLTNLEIEENEKMTILKLFGAKLIEKKSSQTSSATLPMNVTARADLYTANSDFDPSSGSNLQSLLVSSPNSMKSNPSGSQSHRSAISPNPSDKPLLAIKEEKKGAGGKKLEKSYSSLSFNLKKRFLKFSSRDKGMTASENRSSDVMNDSNSNDQPSTSEMAD